MSVCCHESFSGGLLQQGLISKYSFGKFKLYE